MIGNLATGLQRFARIGRADKHGVITIAPRRIYIVPSRYGILFSLLVVVILIASINSASNLGFLTGFFLASIGLVSMVLTWWNLLNLKLVPLAAEPVFAGNAARFPLRLLNERRFPRPGLLLASADSDEKQSLVDLDATGEARLDVEQQARRRGVLEAGRLKLFTWYPLGLFYAWSYLETGQRCIVYPAPAASAPTLIGPDAERADSGERGQGADDFVGHRYYRDGDSMQHIDWKVAARERGLVCKLFGGDHADRLCLDWDVLPDIGTEERLRLLTRAVLDAEETRLDYSLKLPGKTIDASFGRQHQVECLTALALFGSRADG
jgi:uncharacterized protein (DUF58 family)